MSAQKRIFHPILEELFFAPQMKFKTLSLIRKMFQYKCLSPTAELVIMCWYEQTQFWKRPRNRQIRAVIYFSEKTKSRNFQKKEAKCEPSGQSLFHRF